MGGAHPYRSLKELGLYCQQIKPNLLWRANAGTTPFPPGDEEEPRILQTVEQGNKEHQVGRSEQEPSLPVSSAPLEHTLWERLLFP